jgi:hypothetical protein
MAQGANRTGTGTVKNRKYIGRYITRGFVKKEEKKRREEEKRRKKGRRRRRRRNHLIFDNHKKAY